jgi:NADPH-dependent ferric siderophore reductase
MVRIPGLRPKPKRSVHVGEVLRTEWLTPHMVRVVAGGAGLSAFAGSEYTDAYVKVVFLADGVTYPRPLDLDAIRETHPREHWPRNRTYTVRRWDARAREITIDFVVHGDEGLAGPWARDARPGDEILLLGPGGGWSPSPSAPNLLVGDESAIPAIAAALEALGPGATGQVVIEVHGPEDEVPLMAPATIPVRWLHRGDAPVGTTLTEVVSGLDLPADVQAFVHGEAGFVRDLRRFLKQERGLSNDQLSISGYWRQGADDEGWRAVKRDWNAEIEAAEVAAGLT